MVYTGQKPYLICWMSLFAFIWDTRSSVPNQGGREAYSTSIRRAFPCIIGCHIKKKRDFQSMGLCVCIYKGTPGIHTKSGTPVKHQTRICTIWRVNGARRTPNNHKTSEGTSYVPWDNVAAFLWSSSHPVQPHGTTTGDILLALLVCHCHLKHPHHTHATYPNKVVLDKHGPSDAI